MHQPPSDSGPPHPRAERPVRYRGTFTFDADPFWMSPFRALITDLALRAQFDLDTAADITMAVDEAVAMLVRGVPAGCAQLSGHIELTGDGIRVHAFLPEPVPRPTAPVDAFGWRVLRTLADHAELCCADGTLGIVLTKAYATARDDPEGPRR